jgi:hypothetical protein
MADTSVIDTSAAPCRSGIARRGARVSRPAVRRLKRVDDDRDHRESLQLGWVE